MNEDPFRVVVRLACERVFVTPPDVCAMLDADPSWVMFRLSTDLESFAEVHGVVGTEEARLNHQHLLTAARAYVVATRKLTASAVDQGELPLPLDETAT